MFDFAQRFAAVVVFTGCSSQPAIVVPSSVKLTVLPLGTGSTIAV